MSERNKNLEALLNGPPTVDELLSAANVCERLATLIDKDGRDFLRRPDHLRDTVGILKSFAIAAADVERKRRGNG